MSWLGVFISFGQIQTKSESKLNSDVRLEYFFRSNKNSTKSIKFHVKWFGYWIFKILPRVHFPKLTIINLHN